MFITQQSLAALAAEAASSSRRRRNRNFHGADTDAAHRLLNAVEPDSYVRPHRHLDPAKAESIIALRGRFGVVLFDPAGTVTAARVIAPASDTVGVNVPHGTFHTVVALEPDSVFFEAKAGPYIPLEEAEKAPWAPAEGADGAGHYLEALRRLF
jgi:cupin fold WbuC family metalloprotein